VRAAAVARTCPHRTVTATSDGPDRPSLSEPASRMVGLAWQVVAPSPKGEANRREGVEKDGAPTNGKMRYALPTVTSRTRHGGLAGSIGARPAKVLSCAIPPCRRRCRLWSGGARAAARVVGLGVGICALSDLAHARALRCQGRAHAMLRGYLKHAVSLQVILVVLRSTHIGTCMTRPTSR
jgi:hypothetical protein